MKIGVPRESYAGERRVATTPEVAAQLMKLGYGVVVERGAGAEASFSDDAYRAAGCEIVGSTREVYEQCEIVMKVRAPEGEELGMLRSGQTLISFIWPAQNPELLKTLTERGVTADHALPGCGWDLSAGGPRPAGRTADARHDPAP